MSEMNDYYAGKAVGKLIGELIALSIKLLVYLLIYSPIWIFANFLVEKMSLLYEGSKKLEYLTFILVAYLLYCLVFFLKGVVICFKVNQRRIWLTIFIICVLLTCLLPAAIVYMTVYDLVDKSIFWSSLISFVVGLVVYSKYNFMTDVSPRMAFWAYSLAFRLTLGFITNPIDDSPGKGKDII